MDDIRPYGRFRDAGLGIDGPVERPAIPGPVGSLPWRSPRRKVLWAAVGWFLEAYRETFFVGYEDLARIERHVPKAPQSLDRDQRGGTLVRHWNLIEVDLNFLYRTQLGDLARREMGQPPGFAHPEVTIVPLEELAAGKLRATLDRCACGRAAARSAAAAQLGGVWRRWRDRGCARRCRPSGSGGSRRP